MVSTPATLERFDAAGGLPPQRLLTFKTVMTATANAAILGTGANAANPMVGEAEMFADRNIVESAVNSNAHKILVAAVKAAGLAETLSGDGPFTVFASTNEAFAELPGGTVEGPLKSEN